MAKNKSTVYLGYDDEEVTPKQEPHLNSTVNKIGGTPDWPYSEIKVPACPLCGTLRSLIVQLYAPLEHSQFHRSLYVFSCLNPTCSQNSKSWLCIRTQHLDTQGQTDLINAVTTTQPSNVCGGAGAAKQKQKKQAKHSNKIVQNINWCSGADDWGEAAAKQSVAPKEMIEQMDTAADDDFQNEENGNVLIGDGIEAVQHGKSTPDLAVGLVKQDTVVATATDDDDDDEESTSMENELICGLGQLDMNSPQQQQQQQQAGIDDDPNANCAAAVAVNVAGGVGGGDAAIMCGATATICAEIEGTETDVVLVESPKKPERDLIALLKHTSTPAAIGPLAKITDVTLKPYYMAVEIEQRNVPEAEYENYGGALSADHIRELYLEYKRQDEAAHSPGSVAGASGSGAADEQESYEKVLPAHGDMVFHNFITTIQQNPGQLLRYSRDTLPLLIAPLTEALPKCQNCNGDTICEVQILSTLIPKLRLQQTAEAAPIEYGNVLVFTCLKSCWDTPDRMRYERVLVQAEL